VVLEQLIVELRPIGDMRKETVEHVHVACAIVEHNGLVLVAQRNEGMRLPLKWEFPGGKIEVGESPDGCLKRELLEEMSLHVELASRLDSVTHEYSFFTVTLYPFVCTILSGEIVLHEHAAILWLLPEKLRSLDWAEADITVVENYLQSRRVSQRETKIQ
jgi:8-oxo-dGTP diphosphatase